MVVLESHSSVQLNFKPSWTTCYCVFSKAMLMVFLSSHMNLFLKISPESEIFLKTWAADNMTNISTTLFLWILKKQDLRQTGKLWQCTNWKVNLQICELAKALTLSLAELAIAPKRMYILIIKFLTFLRYQKPKFWRGKKSNFFTPPPLGGGY